MKLFIVNSGEYSDYSVDGIYSTREKAQRHMKLFPKSGYSGYNSIQEVEVDKPISEVFTGYYSVAVVTDRPEINVVHISGRGLGDQDFGKVDVQTWDRWVSGNQNEKAKSYSVVVKARNGDHAVKIASDIIAKYKANEAGI